MENLQGILEKAGAKFDDVVKTTIYTTDISIYTAVNQVYSTFFTDHFRQEKWSVLKNYPWVQYWK